MVFLGYHQCKVMKEWSLPVQYTDPPMGSDDQIVRHSYHRLNNEKREGVYRACKYHNIWFSVLYHWQLHPLSVASVAIDLVQCWNPQSTDSHLAPEDENYEVLCQDLFLRSLEEKSEPGNTRRVSRVQWWMRKIVLLQISIIASFRIRLSSEKNSKG